MSDDFWEKNAETWAGVIESRSIASRSITNRAIIDEILRLSPQSVLDIGCGEGWIASELVPRGVEYFGIDGSAKLIEIARARNSGEFERVSYDDIANARWRPRRNVDVAVFNFSLLDEDLVDVLKNTASYLNPGGTLLIQTLHPFFVLKPYRDGWRVEDFKSMSAPFEGTMPWFGRTLDSWSQLFARSGLKLQSIAEPSGAEGPVSVIFRLAR